MKLLELPYPEYRLLFNPIEVDKELVFGTFTQTVKPIMFGTFQQSNLRIEVNASEQKIRDSLLSPGQFRQWLYPQTFSSGLQEPLKKSTTFTSWIGPISISHQVEIAEPNELRMILSGGIDGYHEWRWGEGWVQSCIAGISPLPINLGQTFSLLRLRIFMSSSSKA